MHHPNLSIEKRVRITFLFHKGCSAVGEENYWLGGSGWYAPAINMHWSPFSGRNYEYYSEDPIISGVMAAKVISGAGDKGTFCTLKHFAMVDQEADRWWIPAVWATEQTIREIYLKAFEIAVKDAQKTIKYTSDDKGTVTDKVMRACDAMMASGWSGSCRAKLFSTAVSFFAYEL